MLVEECCSFEKNISVCAKIKQRSIDSKTNRGLKGF